MTVLRFDSDTHRVDQDDVTLASGRRYRLIRARPRRSPPPAGGPVLYLLDGNAAATVLTASLLETVPGLAIICVGYQTDALFAVRERWLDYTPPLTPAGPTPDSRRPDYLAGGAAGFLAALLGQLRHQAERGLAIDPARRALWGHSFGGLLTLYALFTAPAGFNCYYPVSPSLWWGDGVMERLEQIAPPLPAPARRVMVMLGDREARTGQPRPLQPCPAPATLALIDRLRHRPGVEVAARILEGHGHREALFASLPLALADAARATVLSTDGAA